MPDFRITHYDWPCGRETMLRFGPADGPTVIAVLPLFEEANRTRAAIIDTLRRLAARGIACALPDLPGTGESIVPTADATLTDCRVAFTAAAASLPTPVHVMAWRGGALIDVEAAVASRWHLAPMGGTTVIRELRRLRELSGAAGFAGNILSEAMLGQLEAAEPAPAGTRRIVRLSSDPRPADLHLPGTPLWRAAEPGTDAALQAAIADDIAAWIAACGR